MSLRALIAEDELLIALALRSQLESQGFEVVGTAATGQEAVRLCRARRPDVVLMDLRMPVMDGITATRRLMEECPHPVIVVTGNVELRQEAERAGAMEYAVKPVLTQQLPGLIQRAQERFARYLVVHEEEGNCDGALQAWSEVQAAVRRLAHREGLTEAEAFDRLQEAARRQGRRLQEAAEEVLAEP